MQGREVRAADPDPQSVRIAEFERELRDRCPDSFAGLVHRDGVLEVFSTGDARLDAVVVSAAGREPALRVRVVAGMRNSIRELERIRDEVLTRLKAGDPDTASVRSLGVDVFANRVVVGTESPTSAFTTRLEQEFGRDRIQVVRASGAVG